MAPCSAGDAVPPGFTGFTGSQEQTMTALADQMLAAIEEAERLAPDNDHLLNDPTINELCEFAANGRLTMADGMDGQYPSIRPVVVPGSHPTLYGRDLHEAHYLVNKTGRCDRCFSPLDLMRVESEKVWQHPLVTKPLLPVWVSGGRSIIHFNLCHDCVGELDAVVKEF